MKINFVGVFLLFPVAVKNFFSQHLQAHNALKTWIPQSGAADLQESRAALQKDLRIPLVTLTGVTKRLTKAKENSACSYHFGPPILEILSQTGVRPVKSF